jgi:hypothetical protein
VRVAVECGRASPAGHRDEAGLVQDAVVVKDDPTRTRAVEEERRRRRECACFLLKRLGYRVVEAIRLDFKAYANSAVLHKNFSRGC